MSENSGEGRDGSSTLDENEVKKALASSSPAIRIAHLQLIETAIADNGNYSIKSNTRYLY